MHKTYVWLPGGGCFPGSARSGSCTRVARAGTVDKQAGLRGSCRDRTWKGKAEARFALEAVSLQREAVRAQEFRVLQWLVAAIALATLLATAVQAVAALRG